MVSKETIQHDGAGVNIVSQKPSRPSDRPVTRRRNASTRSDSRETPERETALLIGEVLASMGKVADRMEPDGAETRRWMVANSGSRKVAAILKESPFVMLRVLDAIGRKGPVNGITIAREFRVPKGTVSKTTRRLIDAGLAVSDRKPNNRKEILFTLTALGKAVFQVHAAFDRQMERGLVSFLRRYDASRLRILADILRDAADISFLELGALADGSSKPPNDPRDRRGATETTETPETRSRD